MTSIKGGLMTNERDPNQKLTNYTMPEKLISDVSISDSETKHVTNYYISDAGEPNASLISCYPCPGIRRVTNYKISVTS
jgi:hypothetical protein